MDVCIYAAISNAQDWFDQVEITLIKNALVENTLLVLYEITFVDNALVENTLVENPLVKNALVENTLVENALVEIALVKITLDIQTHLGSKNYGCKDFNRWQFRCIQGGQGCFSKNMMMQAMIWKWFVSFCVSAHGNHTFWSYIRASAMPVKIHFSLANPKNVFQRALMSFLMKMCN